VRENSNIHFLEQLLNETDLKRHVTGSAQPKLTAAKLSALPIILPPLPLQQKFADIVRRIERLRVEQREAEHLFQTLLHRAFNGSDDL
jgi:type I restriction enzyme, S subunit